MTAPVPRSGPMGDALRAIASFLSVTGASTAPRPRRVHADTRRITMSYCRFSDDDFRCEVYVYESARGYETHVAARRRVLREDMLPPPLPDGASLGEWLARCMRVVEIVGSAERQEIDLPEAGRSFLHATPGECADNLERLRAVGFRVPQYAIDALRAEMAQARTRRQQRP